MIARPDGHQRSSYLARTIAEHEITMLQLVPSMLRIFLEQDNVTQLCRSLKRMFCGGEALSADLRDRFYSLLDGDMINLYGPTETSIDAGCYPCRRDDDEPGVTLGRPLPTCRSTFSTGICNPHRSALKANYISAVSAWRAVISIVWISRRRFYSESVCCYAGCSSLSHRRSRTLST